MYRNIQNSKGVTQRGGDFPIIEKPTFQGLREIIVWDCD